MKKVRVKFDGFNGAEPFTLNREARMILSLLEKHYEVELSDFPDYVFCNVNSRDYYKYDGIRIFCTIEAICPDFNLCDYGIGFEYLEFMDRYFRFPNYGFYSQVVADMIDKHKNVESELTERQFCSFVYSNAKADSMREQLYNVLNAYRVVDSGGKYLNNQPDGRAVEDKLAFEKVHKFSIACENASHPGYHTEKLIEAFAAGTVPIYWGDPEVGKVFNKKAFVDVNDFDCLEDVVSRVKELDENPELYLAMLKEPAVNIGNDEIPYTGCETGRDVAEHQLHELEEYLVHIFDQPLDKAYRRNRGFWGMQYLQEKRSVGRIIENYMKLRDFPIAKLIRKWRKD